jgi:hypothetical protein
VTFLMLSSAPLDCGDILELPDVLLEDDLK